MPFGADSSRWNPKPRLLAGFLVVGVLPAVARTTLADERAATARSNDSGRSMPTTAADALDKRYWDLHERHGDVQAFAVHPAASLVGRSLRGGEWFQECVSGWIGKGPTCDADVAPDPEREPVGWAVARMDRATPSNAAQAGEFTATASTLSDRASEAMRRVRRFPLASSGGSAAGSAGRGLREAA